MSPARRPQRPAARGRADPGCPTCHGSGRFVAFGKAHETELRCPRCLGPPSVSAVPPGKVPALRPEALQIP